MEFPQRLLYFLQILRQKHWRITDISTGESRKWDLFGKDNVSRNASVEIITPFQQCLPKRHIIFVSHLVAGRIVKVPLPFALLTISHLENGNSFDSETSIVIRILAILRQKRL